MSGKTGLPLKWHGGKAYLARKIVALMPPHLHYVEPFAGGLAVLLAYEGPPRSELVNDKNVWLTTFWRVMQRPEWFERFHRRMQATPLSRAEWEWADAFMDDCRGACDSDPVEAACWFFVNCRQSLAGRMKGFTAPTRTRLRRGMNGNVSEWLGAVEGLPAAHARLKTVFVECMDALKLIPREDTPGTLFYLDPPYVPESRSTPDVYAHEMTQGQHAELLGLLPGLKGKWMLSGYDNPLYESFFKDFPHTRHEFDLPNNAAGGKAKARETEVLWCNFGDAP